MTPALTPCSLLSCLALCAALGCSSGSDGGDDGGDASKAGTGGAPSAGSGRQPTAGSGGAGAGGTSGTGTGGIGGASDAGTSGAGDGGTSGAGGDDGGTGGATDGGGVDAGPVGECAGSKVCTADYPCQNLAPDYTCRGQFADWTPSDSPATFTDNGDGTVTDSRSGLAWQHPVDDGRVTWADAKSYCAGLSLAGGGWRLPTKAELESIIDFGSVDPAIDKAAFPDTRAGHFWSSSAYVGASGGAWAVNFIVGVSFNYDVDVTSDTKFVRCVRGDATVTPSTGSGGAPPTRYTLSDDTVKDNRTDLTWQREVAASVYAQAAAVTYCSDLELGGSSDWRLPAVSELLTLVDPTSSAPAIAETAFPSTPSEWTWSSSANLGQFGGAWGVDFEDGSSFTNGGSYEAHVRCVR